MKTDDNSSLVEVFAGTSWQAGMVKSLLESAGIDAFIKDYLMGMMNPWWTAPGGAGAVKVYVARWNEEEAKEIVAGYEENMKNDPE